MSIYLVTFVMWALTRQSQCVILNYLEVKKFEKNIGVKVMPSNKKMYQSLVLGDWSSILATLATTMMNNSRNDQKKAKDWLQGNKDQRQESDDWLQGDNGWLQWEEDHLQGARHDHRNDPNERRLIARGRGSMALDKSPSRKRL